MTETTNEITEESYTPFNECSHIGIKIGATGYLFPEQRRDINLVCEDCGGTWSVKFWNGKKQARIKFFEIQELDKEIIGVFTGCSSSDDNLCDEIHVRIVDPVIVKHPIWMFPAIAHFQHIKLERGDRISLELNEGKFVVIKSIKILEKDVDPELKPRRRRLRASRTRRSIKRAAVFDKTIGWFKHTFLSGRRFHWLPVKQGSKGGIWIPNLGLSARRYITQEKFFALEDKGIIVRERPKELEGKTSVKWGTKK